MARGLRPEGERDGRELFHASARDPVWEYILSGEAAADALELTSAPVVLVGHSHVALAIGLRDRRLSGGVARAGKEVELDGSRAGCSTRARSASRGTAIRARPTCCSTSTRGARSSGASATTSSGHRRRSGEHGLPAALAERLAVGA